MGERMIKLAKYGKREWMGGGIVALVLAAIGIAVARTLHGPTGWSIASIAVLAWVALAAFFRVPTRRITQEAMAILSPADGVVKDIEVVADHGIEPFAEQPLLRIGIFLSVLDVHVNRAPTDMEVSFRRYKEGRFHDARDPRCSKENESLLIAGTAWLAGKCFPVAVRQISGAIARRIVCEADPGDRLERGEIYGMIKFGSRTELFLPADGRIGPAVAIGSRVYSGTTVVARLQPESVYGHE